MRTFTLLLALAPFSLFAQTWSHSGQPAQLVQLFTSEGCSSCPPADRYLSKFKGHSGLWEEVIPTAYHVDYWDYIGWKDRFANPAFSQKQRLYRSYGVLGSVYTPGFVVDGQEWKGFFYRSQRKLPLSSAPDAKTLKLVNQDMNYSLSFSDRSEYVATIVWLALDETTEVKRGENRGRTLSHDFVVLEEQQKLGKGEWTFMPNDIQGADAVAVWLTKRGEFQPVQTVAGYLDRN
ncbi:hypothetical protein JCM19232_485 [Vibrio ishigakensis]|uniref:Secreted protein n=1 Tax=Vibrio ishigakensis TaxID=1481914 RepID=A0A0B8P6H0_9VIBR|nr:hypothetical protein JCM19232_485 [Vibrio ishigakensis]